MSAYLVSPKHTMAAAILAHRLNVPGICATERATAKLLRDDNNTALAARYGAEPIAMEDEEDVDMAETAALLWVISSTPAQHACVARCIRYQCGEGDCDERTGFQLLMRLVEATEALTTKQAQEACNTWSI